MKKLHVHISVKNLEQSTEFYRRLFNAEPLKIKPDYVKWDLDNPALNFAISTHGKAGLEHLGIEAGDSDELAELYRRIESIDAKKDEQGETVCCYARSVKSWLRDPQDINWELFHSINDEESYHDETNPACCADQPSQQPCC